MSHAFAAFAQHVREIFRQTLKAHIAASEQGKRQELRGKAQL